MQDVNVGLVGMGNVGGGSLEILMNSGDEIARKLGFRLVVKAVCSRSVASKTLPPGLENILKTADWRQVVTHPEIDIVAELVGGTSVAREVIDAAIAHGKSVVTANKELMGLSGLQLWHAAQAKGATLAMEASVCGGIPVHAVLREGIAGDSVETLFGILNGTSNYILTEIEARGAEFNAVLKEAQDLGYAEADPSADIDGFDARSKLALLASLAFGVSVAPSAIPTEGIRRIGPVDFAYAHQLGYTIRLLCAGRRAEGGLFLSVRPAMVPMATILAGVKGAYNAVWVKGRFGQDTFYYGRGAGALPTGVAVVSDLMRVAREIRFGSAERVSPFAFANPGEANVLPLEQQQRPWYLRFRVRDQPGIIAQMAAILAKNGISVDAVLQLPAGDKQNLPFVITIETTREAQVREAVAEMEKLPYMVEAPVAMPVEGGL
jgi:homoserine dehydrogenase